jgi:hypothetical protein
MVTLELPLFVMATVCELELPALTLPKDRFAGFAESVTVAATPVPLSVTLAGELGALLTMLTVPARFPAVLGANNTVKEALPPLAIVAGAVSPLTLKPLPLTLSCEIVKEALPVFVTVNACDLV